MVQQAKEEEEGFLSIAHETTRGSDHSLFMIVHTEHNSMQFHSYQFKHGPTTSVAVPEFTTCEYLGRHITS